MIRTFVWSVSVVLSITAMILFFSLPSRADVWPYAPVAPIAPIAPIYPITPAMFTMSAQIWGNAWGIRVGVANNLPRPIACQGQVAAVSVNIGPHWLNFLTPVIYPGTWGYVDLRPMWGDAFVNGNAYAYCWWL